MRSRFFTAVLVCSVGLGAQACAASGDDGTGGLIGTKKDSGVDTGSVKDSGSTQPDTSVTNPPTDSGTTTLPPPDDTGVTPPDDTSVTPPDDTGVADTYVPPADTYVPPVDMGGGGTTGNACTASASCGGGNKCVAFEAPVCAGAPCTNPTSSGSSSGYADYSPCDSNSGVCSPDTTLNDGTGYCVPQCAVPLGGGAASGCLAGDTCIVQILNSSATGAIGSCEGGACTADSQCTAVSSTYTKCQKETLNCVKPADFKTFGANGAACTLSTSGASSPTCVCLAANPTTTSTKGYCSNICITGDAAHGCPSGYTCDPLLSATYFSAIPTGVTGYCSKSCTTSSGCPTGTTCQSFGGTKVCAP